MESHLTVIIVAGVAIMYILAGVAAFTGDLALGVTCAFVATFWLGVITAGHIRRAIRRGR